MGKMTFAILTSTQPDCGAATREPSLEDIVLRYYAAHFPAEVAALHTTNYFAALKRHIG
jgi:hypothetical protein